MKKFFVKLCSILICCLFAFNAFGCAPDTTSGETPYSMTFSAFNTGVHIQTVDKELSSENREFIRDIVELTENIASPNKVGSFVHTFNNAGENQAVSLGEDDSISYALAMLIMANVFYTSTEGRFNPAIYPLMELWGFLPTFTDVNFTPPTDAQIEQALAYCNFDDVGTFDDNLNFVKSKAEYKIDFGGFAKGFAADYIGLQLADEGFTKGYVNIGSSSFYILSVDSLGIRHPNNKTKTIMTLDGKNLNNLSVSTSGTYEKVHAGTNYHHIIDPRTGRPADTGFKSVTVINADGMSADIYSTAFCVCSHDPNNLENSEFVNFAKTLIKDDLLLSVYAVYEKDGVKQILTNKTQGEDFTLLDSTFSIVKF